MKAKPDTVLAQPTCAYFKEETCDKRWRKGARHSKRIAKHRAAARTSQSEFNLMAGDSPGAGEDREPEREMNIKKRARAPEKERERE